MRRQHNGSFKSLKSHSKERERELGGQLLENLLHCCRWSVKEPSLLLPSRLVARNDGVWPQFEYHHCLHYSILISSFLPLPHSWSLPQSHKQFRRLSVEGDQMLLKFTVQQPQCIFLALSGRHDLNGRKNMACQQRYHGHEWQVSCASNSAISVLCVS